MSSTPQYSKSKSGQQYYLVGLEDLVSRHPTVYSDLLAKILHALYDKDVLSDQTILAWHSSLASSADPTKVKMAAKLKALVAWLEQSDSESEEESD